MATCTLFEEDEVYVHKQGKGYQFGLVLENSEFFSSEDEDESERPEDRLKRGSVRVAWYPTGKETVVAENKVVLADRSLMPGDIVRRLIPGQESQSGFVMDMDVKCQLHVKRTNKFIYNVNSRDLEPLLKFESGQNIMLDSWIGKVETVNVDIILLFSDGARCQVDENDLYAFDDVTDKVERHGEFGVCLSYPGQELRGPLEHLCDGKWLYSTPRHCHKSTCKKGRNLVQGTVEKIITRSVEAHWVWGCFDTPTNAPSRFVTGDKLERLQVLNWFEHCSIQIADRMLYRVKNDDCISTIEPNQAFNPNSITGKGLDIVHTGACSNDVSNKPIETKDTQESEDNEALLLNEEEDCEYEDVDEDSDNDGDKASTAQNKGTCGRSYNKKKKSGFKATVPKFKAGKLVQKSATGGLKRKRAAKERTVNPDDLVEVEVVVTSSWATVMWQDGSIEAEIPSVELFPVHHLDELEFFPGDYVLPAVELDFQPTFGVVVKTDHHERVCTVHWVKDIDNATSTVLSEDNREMSVYDIHDHPNFKFRPGHCVVRVSWLDEMDMKSFPVGQRVGQVIKLDPSGRLVVRWANGNISQCLPQEVFTIFDDNDDLSNEGSWETDDESGSSSAETWETESEQEIVGEDEEPKSDQDSIKFNSSSLAEHKQELDSLLSRAQSALVKLQTLLNSFDITVSAPDCFHDIISIYRNCHDLDKILKSSFFSDSELQSLIAQAKLEIKRDKTRDKSNKIYKHLSQFFESWSKSSSECSGTLGDKTIRVDTSNSGKTVRMSIGSPNHANNKSIFDTANKEQLASPSLDCDPEMKGECSCPGLLNDNEWEGRALRKEFSEPVINQLCNRNGDAGERRPSDPVVDVAGVGAKSKTKSMERNLVGENCVGKAPKRSKPDAHDDSGRDVKKSREDGQNRNHAAQELCFKICQNLQMQILKIHEEVNKRTKRLLSSEAAANSGQDVGNKEEASSVEKGTKDSTPSNEDTSISADKACAEENTDEIETKKKDELEADAVSSETISEDGSAKADNSSNTPEEESPDEPAPAIPSDAFKLNEEVNSQHKFAKQSSQPSNPRTFRNAVRREMNLFRSSLPKGIFVRGFEDRVDLYSVMILGPEGTPYEDGLFLFDFMLPNDYPNSPPVCHYHSFVRERLNPNLYEDGNVCVSLLGTWSGKGTEVWTSKSNLFQVLLSVQGLILVPEPYYNEAGYERQRGTQVGLENSRVYNEMAILKTVCAMINICKNPPAAFQEEICNYVSLHGPRMIARLRKWLEYEPSGKENTLKETQPFADSSTLPVSEPAFSDSPSGPHPSSNGIEANNRLGNPAVTTSADSSQCTSASTPVEGNEALVVDKFRKLQVNGEESPPNVITKDPSREQIYNTHQSSPSSLEADSSQSDGNRETSQVNCDNSKTLSSQEQTSSTDNLLGAEGGTAECGNGNSCAAPVSPNCSANERLNLKDTFFSSDFRNPQFPLLPMSRGFRLSLQSTLNLYEQALKQLKDPQPKEPLSAAGEDV